MLTQNATIIAIVKQTTTQIKKIAKKAMQVIENATKEASRNKIIKNIRFQQSYNVSDNNSDQYDRPNQSQKTNPIKQQNYKIVPRHTKTQ